MRYFGFNIMFLFICYFLGFFIVGANGSTPNFTFSPNFTVEYKEGDYLQFDVTLVNLPAIADYELFIMGKMGKIYYSNSSGNVNPWLKTFLYKYMDNEKYYLRVQLQTKDVLLYEIQLMTLKFVTYQVSAKHACLTEVCHIIVKDWPTKGPNIHNRRDPRDSVVTENFTSQTPLLQEGQGNNPSVKAFQSQQRSALVTISPNGTVEVGVREDIEITCEQHYIPVNNILTLYDAKNGNSEGSVKATMKKKFITHLEYKETTKTLYCQSTFIDHNISKSVNSEKLQLKQKTTNEKIKYNLDLIISPLLPATVVYRNGDHFTYTCNGKNAPKNTNYSWKQINHGKNTTLNTGVSNVSVDIVLDENDNGSQVQCVASYYDGVKYVDSQTGVATLILGHSPNTEQASDTVIYWAPCLVLIIILLSALVVIKVYRSRNRGKKVEVNELYGCHYEVPYAQVYAGREGAMPVREPVEYAKIIGYLAPK